LIVQSDGVKTAVCQSEEEHAQREKNFGSTRGITGECLGTEQTLENVLSQSREKTIANFENVVNDVELNGGLGSDEVIHATCIEGHESHGTANDDSALEEICFMESGQVGGH
jgi:hypothetical protein